MRDDLLEAQACIDWAVSQIPVLADRIEVWLKGRPYVFLQQFDPKKGKDALKINPGDPLPLIINAEAGAIINSARSALDLLAVALAERNGYPASKCTYFPVFRDRAAFDDPNDPTHKKICRLSSSDQAEIKKIRPYSGGNDALADLHALDILRKHQRLIEARGEISRVNLQGWGLDASFPENVWIGLEDDTPHAWINPGAKGYQRNVTIEVTLRQPSTRARDILTIALHKLASTAQAVIVVFDA